MRPGARTSLRFSRCHLFGLVPICGRGLTRGAINIRRMRKSLGGTPVSARRAVVALTLDILPARSGAPLYSTRRAEQDTGCEIRGARSNEPDQGTLQVVQHALNSTAARVRRGGQIHGVRPLGARAA
jgi:hypothetical protein